MDSNRGNANDIVSEAISKQSQWARGFDQKAIAIGLKFEVNERDASQYVCKQIRCLEQFRCGDTYNRIVGYHVIPLKITVKQIETIL